MILTYKQLYLKPSDFTGLHFDQDKVKCDIEFKVARDFDGRINLQIVGIKDEQGRALESFLKYDREQCLKPFLTSYYLLSLRRGNEGDPNDLESA